MTRESDTICCQPCSFFLQLRFRFVITGVAVRKPGPLLTDGFAPLELGSHFLASARLDILSIARTLLVSIPEWTLGYQLASGVSSSGVPMHATIAGEAFAERGQLLQVGLFSRLV